MTEEKTPAPLSNPFVEVSPLMGQTTVLLELTAYVLADKDDQKAAWEARYAFADAERIVDGRLGAQEQPAQEQSEEQEPTAWVGVLKEAVVQLDTARCDRREEGSEEIALRIEEVITRIEDELEELTGEKIPHPLPQAHAPEPESGGDG